MLTFVSAMIAFLQVPPVSPAQEYPDVLTQNPIQWIANTQQGISLAQSTARPVLFYIPSSSGLYSTAMRRHWNPYLYGTWNSDITDAQNLAFRDPIVRAFAEDRFVPIRLQVTNQTLPMLAEAGLPTTYGSYLAVYTPEGKYFGSITPTDAADPGILARRLSELYRGYRFDLYRREVRPVLENMAATPSELDAALHTIQNFTILDSDQELIALLDRPGLKRNVRDEVIDTLAVLSTPEAAEALVRLAGTNKYAAQALNRLTLPAMVHTLSVVDVNDPAQVVAVYDAAVKMAGFSDPKLRPFWTQASPAARKQELARVEGVLKPQADRWQEIIGVLR